MAKRVEVTLLGIRCVAENDGPGNELEIFGDLYANVEYGSQAHEILMWSASNSGHEDIKVGNALPINKTEIINMNEGERLALGGTLFEWDGPDIAKDPMGNRSIRVNYSEINQYTTPYLIEFSYEGQVVLAEYNVREYPSLLE
ncbi:hypothetical protein [Bacillus cereus]|uniref:hypothetical protein n=1 Tax=Bacillus cereus TaxID=1396 RepID=UPI000BF5E7CB|nr:hypothetical protein [Bacillus cereus]PEQ27893.1 hypothetical protein CN466_26940 [Bacillus cereus]